MYAETADADKQVIDAATAMANEKGVAQATLALAWMLTKPYVSSPIIGATKPHHIEDAVKAIAVKLSAEEVATLESFYVPHPVLGF
jgi:aryl-alcohol dehydrogenase-like predicted oxidoreductase